MRFGRLVHVDGWQLLVRLIPPQVWPCRLNLAEALTSSSQPPLALPFTRTADLPFA